MVRSGCAGPRRSVPAARPRPDRRGGANVPAVVRRPRVRPARSPRRDRRSRPRPRRPAAGAAGHRPSGISSRTPAGPGPGAGRRAGPGRAGHRGRSIGSRPSRRHAGAEGVQDAALPAGHGAYLNVDEPGPPQPVRKAGPPSRSGGRCARGSRTARHRSASPGSAASRRVRQTAVQRAAPIREPATEYSWVTNMPPGRSTLPDGGQHVVAVGPALACPAGSGGGQIAEQIGGEHAVQRLVQAPAGSTVRQILGQALEEPHARRASPCPGPAPASPRTRRRRRSWAGRWSLRLTRPCAARLPWRRPLSSPTPRPAGPGSMRPTRSPGPSSRGPASVSRGPASVSGSEQRPRSRAQVPVVTRIQRDHQVVPGRGQVEVGEHTSARITESPDERLPAPVRAAAHGRLARSLFLPRSRDLRPSRAVRARGWLLPARRVGCRRLHAVTRFHSMIASVTIANPKPKSSTGMSQGTRTPSMVSGL